MSRVIRISDETFTRLQSLAEPLIDTPSSLIEKLLDYYEASSVTGKTNQAIPSDKAFSEVKRMNSALFLAPAMEENYDSTIRNSITLDKISHLLSTAEKESLRQKSSDINSLHCWATTESNKSKFEQMSEGDIVLFTVKNTGKFVCYGEVTFKTDNKKLGDFLWKHIPKRPWSLIYFLEKIRNIDIDKSYLVAELGYNKNFVVPGFTKVNQFKLNVMISRYGSLESLIDSLSD